MKVLVFDDNEIHRQAAEAQLGSTHDLTVVGTYEEAQKLLEPTVDSALQESYFLKKYGDSSPYKSEGISNEERSERIDYWHEAEKLATSYPDFDVVLSDLFVPAPKLTHGYEELVGQEMPLGIYIGLWAAISGRAKYVAVFTDTNHHKHPVSACFDSFSLKLFKVEDSKVVLSNTQSWVSMFDTNDLSKEMEDDLQMSQAKQEEEWTRTGKAVKTKNWLALLEYLLDEKL